MDTNSIQILIAMALYMVATVVIGVWFARRANDSSENYFLGGRSLGPWVAAMSAEASDMSGWLLMGLPGVAYWTGIADAAWTAIGLAVGTYVNWLIVSRRLRRYSLRANNSITLPDFFSNRFREKRPVILLISSLFILVFFTVYAASCLVTCAKLFSQLFGASYQAMLIVGALFVFFYTILGGFLAESVSDFMQAIVMIVALVVVVLLGVANVEGGIAGVIENAKSIPGFFSFFTTASPAVENGAVTFGEPDAYGALKIVSTMAWGLGYFGMPQVLLRFMAIRKEKELFRSRRIAMVWVVISLFVAVLLGVIGKAYAPSAHLSAGDAESIFITLSTSLLPPLFAGFVMAGILAAAMSSSDSYLLVAASAVAKDLYQGIFKKNATDAQVLRVSRLTLVLITLIATVIAWDENSVIFSIVSFAWAGFGATFGPLVLFSLFWKRATRAGAIAGMLGGGAMVFVWKLVIAPLGGVFAIYELLPAFLISSLLIVAVSLLSKKPAAEVEADFEAVRLGNVEE